jgi:acyl-coenzyme A synthetase/AMP-(fatty) acid ligase
MGYGRRLSLLEHSLLPVSGVSWLDPLDETTGESVTQGQGLLVLKRPWPAMLRTLYGDDQRYIETYFSGFGPQTYLVGDAAIRDQDGYLWIVGRIDDVINVSGHRLSTAEVESAIVAHEKVAEAAVVARSDELTGQAIVAFVTLQGSTSKALPRSKPRFATTSPIRSVSSHDRSKSCGRTTCPRPAPARSCAACCATSPKAARSGT